MNPATPIDRASAVLEALVDEQRPIIGIPILIIVAHPDDETIGIGAQLWRLRNVTLIHVTEGSPANLADAQVAGFSTASEYATERRKELLHSLGMAGIPDDRALNLGICDQDAAQNLPKITRMLRSAIGRLAPTAILTHPYEGGHPDHDATAFCVHSACEGLPIPPVILETPYYHLSNGEVETGKFLDYGADSSQKTNEDVWTAYLTPEEIDRKRKMLSCFTSQQRVLSVFRTETELFRRAPDYDFGVPPHPGILHYEKFRFGINGTRFRELVRSAMLSV